MSKRFSNKGLWVSIISLIMLVGSTFGFFAKLGITSDKVQAVLNAILTVFIAAGIISDPTTENSGYLDDNAFVDDDE